MGDILCRQEQYQKAVPHLLKAKKGLPNDIHISGNLGYALYETGQFEKAVPYLKTLEKKYPGDEDSKMMLGYALFKAGKIKQAVHYIKLALPHIDIRMFENEMKDLLSAGMNNVIETNQSLKPK